MNHIIRIKNRHSQLPKIVGKETLATGNTARYGDSFSHSEECFSRTSYLEQITIIEL